ncbi:MAG: alpha/beta hydrolase [Ancalomicrobiaceae bacterium]|nr:alpha/beta hydrolase [Ancalomicrobiaceae bacterium]
MVEFLWSRPDGTASGTVVMAHGSGGPMDSPFMERMAGALAAEGLAVARFEFAYMAKRRQDGKKRFPSELDKLVAEMRNAVRLMAESGDCQGPLILAGKSLGGRVAVTAAAEPLAPVAGIACLGYPLHPTGEPEKLRLSPLLNCKLPLIIAQGTRDDFGNRAEFEALSLPKPLDIVWLEDGSHDFGPRGQSGATLKGNIAAAAAAVAAFAHRLAASEEGSAA